MCGRYVRKSSAEAFGRLFHARVRAGGERSFNVSPSQEVLVARNDAGGGRELVLLRWGLVPFWAKDPRTGFRMINARAETVATKPAFRSAFRRRRCLVAADGFYEWSAADGRQPFYIHMADDAPFGFAGLHEHWEGQGRAVDSCTIIVGQPNELVARIHDRMPCILRPGAYDAWLDPENSDQEKLLPLLQPFPADGMAAYPVSRQVNIPRNQGPSLNEPLAEERVRPIGRCG